MVIKAGADARPPETGVSRIPPPQAKIWRKGERRWRYAASYKDPVTGKSLGGRFTTPSEHAKPHQKPGFYKKKHKAPQRT